MQKDKVSKLALEDRDHAVTLLAQLWLKMQDNELGEYGVIGALYHINQIDFYDLIDLIAEARYRAGDPDMVEFENIGWGLNQDEIQLEWAKREDIIDVVINNQEKKILLVKSKRN